MGRILRILALGTTVALSCVVGSANGAQQPVRNLQVTLRGKKYDVPESVTTVRDLHEQMKERVGKVPSAPQSVLFEGRRLHDDDVLSEAGVTDGSQLNMVPASSSSSSSASSKKKKAEATVSGAGDVTAGSSSSTGASEDKMESIEAAMQDYLKQAGVDTGKLEEMMKNFGGAGAGGEGSGEMPSMKESLEMMNSMMQSDLFQSYMSDPEKLEQSRQMILNNPMLKSMMAGMPGMDQILNDPVAWREAMQAAASMYKNMDPDMLMSMMNMGGAGGAPGMGGGGAGAGGGLFDGTLDPSSTAAAAALDELDEDE